MGSQRSITNTYMEIRHHIGFVLPNVGKQILAVVIVFNNQPCLQ